MGASRVASYYPMFPPLKARETGKWIVSADAPGKVRKNWKKCGSYLYKSHASAYNGGGPSVRNIKG